MRIVKVTQALPNNRAGWKIGDQVIRSGTKETLFWLKLIIACELIPEKRLINIINEIDEIASILTAIVKTGEQKLNDIS